MEANAQFFKRGTLNESTSLPRRGGRYDRKARYFTCASGLLLH